MGPRIENIDQESKLRFCRQTLFALGLVVGCFGLWRDTQAQTLVPTPLGLAQIGPYSGQVNLVWTPNPTATTYQVSRALLDMTTTPTPSIVSYVPYMANVPTGTPVFTDFQVTDGRTYQYLVAGMDSAGNLGLPATIAAIPYTIPGVVNPTVSNLHANSLDLSWNVPLSTFPILFYNIYRQSPAGGAVSTTMSAAAFFTASPIPIATTLGTSYTDQQVSPTPNFYAVVAVDSQPIPTETPAATQLVIGSFPSFSTSGALPINALQPAAPLLFGFIPVAGYGTQISGTPTATPTYGVDLVWNGALASENVTNYQIYANTTEIATLVVTQTPLPTYSYIDSTLIPGSLVDYSIVAVNAVGTVTSNTISENIVAPSGVTAIQVTPNATPNSFTFTWNQGTQGTYGLITKYAVYQGTSGAPVPYATAASSLTSTPTPNPIAVIIETPSRTPTVMAVVNTGANTNGFDYTYWVQPVDAVGLGGPIAASTPLNFGPTPVTGVTASLAANSNNKVNITWSSASAGYYGAVADYKIYQSVNGITPTAIATVGPTRTSRNSYVVASAGSIGVYSVSAIDGFGNASDMSAPSTVSLNNLPTGVINPPQTPHLLTTTQSGNSLTYTWLLNSSLDNVTNYSIYDSNYISYIATTTITPTAVVSVLTPSFTASNVSYWQPTPYYLVANNFVGTSTPGISAPATLAALQVPPYVVTAVVQPTQGVNVVWNMTPPAVATPYVDSIVVYRALEHPALTPEYFRPIATISVSTPTYLDGNVTPGTQYLYMVTGRSNNLSGTPTPVFESPVSVTGIAYPTVVTWPNVPPAFSANTGSSATTLYWGSNPTPDVVQGYVFSHNGAPVPAITANPAPTMTAVFPETQGNVSSYQVFAYNAGGSSNSSVTLSVLGLPVMTPTVVITPVVTPGTTPAVWISGLTYPGVVGSYNVYRATDAGFFTKELISTITSPNTSMFDTGYSAGSINYYKTVAVANSNAVTANFTLSGLIGITLWPNPPSNVLTNASANAVTLSWSGPVSGSSPVTAYWVYKGTASGAETPILTPVPSLGSFVDTQVTLGTPYYYYMESISGGLNSPPTSEHAVIPSQAPILNAVSSNGQALLTWSPVTVAAGSPITEYVVSKLTMPTPGTGAPITPSYPFTTTNLTTTSYQDSAIAYNTGYVYQVAPIAFTTPGVTIYGSYSNSVTLTAPPQGPTSVSAVSGDQLAQLRWNYQGPLINYSYSIQRKLGTAPVSAYQTIASGITGLDYTDNGLLDKTLYNYKIVAVPTANTSLSGISQPVNALPAKPPVVDNPALSLVQTQNGNTISWTAANSNPGDFNSSTMYPLGGYHVYRSSDGGGTYQLLDAQGDTLTSYTDQVSIINGSSYQYLVKAYDTPPNVSTSDPNMVHESTYNTVVASGLNASTALDRNSLRPYGASNEQVVHVRFVVTNPGNVQIKVYSLAGVFIKQLVSQYFGIGVYGIVGSSYPLQWDGRNANGNFVASGVYLITTEMNGLQTIDKIAVIK